MFYLPKFCNECGVKIESGGRNFWTGNRFCGSCAIDKKAHEWLRRIAAAFCALCGLFGIGSFLLPSEKPLIVTTAQTNATNFSKDRQVSGKNTVQPSSQTQNAANGNQVLNVNQSLKNESEPKSAENPRLQLKASSQTKDETGEPVYFCGAQTKKGTACSRRVKGGGRCWQHAGQTALLPPEKLLIRQ